jgi:hypothetical protein
MDDGRADLYQRMKHWESTQLQTKPRCQVPSVDKHFQRIIALYDGMHPRGPPFPGDDLMAWLHDREAITTYINNRKSWASLSTKISFFKCVDFVIKYLQGTESVARKQSSLLRFAIRQVVNGGSKDATTSDVSTADRPTEPPGSAFCGR